MLVAAVVFFISLLFVVLAVVVRREKKGPWFLLLLNKQLSQLLLHETEDKIVEHFYMNSFLITYFRMMIEIDRDVIVDQSRHLTAGFKYEKEFKIMTKIVQ